MRTLKIIRKTVWRMMNLVFKNRRQYEETVLMGYNTCAERHLVNCKHYQESSNGIDVIRADYSNLSIYDN